MFPSIRITTATDFLQFFVARSKKYHVLQGSSALSYITLLSLVPFLTVIFTLLPKIMNFDIKQGMLANTLFSYVTPEFSDTLENYLFIFIDRAASLTFFGAITLIVISLMLLDRIDGEINRIWDVKKNTKRISRFLSYWAILTITPALLGIGFFATSYLLSLQSMGGVLSTGLDKLLKLLPVFTSTIAFSLLYIFVPRTLVPWKIALFTAFVVAILFEIAKIGFGFYIRWLPSYELIYGSIALIPLFLIWVYISWSLVLLGVNFCYCLVFFRSSTDLSFTDGAWHLQHVVIVLWGLWENQNKSVAITPNDLSAQIQFPVPVVNQILEQLSCNGWACKTMEHRWVLQKNLYNTSLYHLHQICCKKMHISTVYPSETTHVITKNLNALLNSSEQAIAQKLNCSLASLFEKKAVEKSS